MSDKHFLLWTTRLKEGSLNTKPHQKITRELREQYEGVDWFLDVLPFMLVFDVKPEVVLTWLERTRVPLIDEARSWCIKTVLYTDQTVEMPFCLQELRDKENQSA